MSDRVRCCVPFCRRSRKPGCDEWICGVHWALVPKSARRVHFRIARAYRKRFGSNSPWVYPGGSEERIKAWALIHRGDRVWSRIKRIAIERAAGI